LQEKLKLDAIRPDADLVDFARALDQVRLTRNKEQNAAGEVQDLENRHSELLTNLSDALEGHGEEVPTDAATAKASLNQLADRDGQLRTAISDHDVVSAQLEQTTADRDAAENAIAQVYSTSGLDVGDLHGLTMLLGSLPRYMELKRDIDRLESQNELDRSALAKAGEAELIDFDELELEQLHENLKRSAEQASESRDEIAEINAEVNAARSGHNVQDLIAERDQALIRLEESRSDVLYAQAGRFLMDGVEKEYEQTQMPHVLERARDLFSAFTHHHYELRLGSPDQPAQLIAIDLQSGEGLELEELSDGTRAQLLLAARIAYAEEVEQGRTLPLFLDEALDQSDPVRYEAIVRSLGRVAADDGRQIFYLTSDPADVGRIQHALAQENYEPPVPIDLGLLRRSAVSVSGPSALHVDPRPPVPQPDGLSAEEYGVALGVPPLDPSLGHAHQHFFHVLWDDLDLLHEFLAHGIEHVGQWKTVLGTPLAERLGTYSKSPEEISHRADLLENFCEFWRQGRGQPIDRDILEASGAVSDRFFDGIAEMAEELGGEAEKLLNAIRSREDERSSGFRSNALEKLEQYFRENGYVDDDPVLNEEELRLRALASPAANQLPEGVADECLNRWWTLAIRLIEPKADKPN
ncbi:MAG: ATP-binding protein, partial [Planctomycetota bacterium]